MSFMGVMSDSPGNRTRDSQYLKFYLLKGREEQTLIALHQILFLLTTSTMAKSSYKVKRDFIFLMSI